MEPKLAVRLSLTIRVVSHHHPAGVARQTLGRSSWNACAVLEDRLAGLIGVGEDFGVHVDHHLVAFARGAGSARLVPFTNNLG